MRFRNQTNSTAIKAGIGYILSAVLTRGLGFITIPLFTRLLTQEEYGYYANYAAWLSVLTILTTLDLHCTIARAKFDYSDNLDSYISSVQILGTLVCSVFYLLVCLCSDFFCNLFSIDMQYIHIMFIYMLVAPSFSLLQAKNRQLMKYKLVTGLSILSAVSVTIFSIALVVTFDNRLTGRIVGDAAPMILLCVIIYLINLYKGHTIFNWSYWKYALIIAVPYVPHLLSGNILGTTDQMIITHFWGAAETALYSVPYTASSILLMIGSAINQAWSPWFYEALVEKKFASIQAVMKFFLQGTLIVGAIIMLIGPEVVLILGGSSYLEGASIMPPVMGGMIIWFLYTFFVNVEIFEKKTARISSMTIIAAIVNLTANLLLVPHFGFTAAAWTTFASYVLLFFLHYFSAKSLGIEKYYNIVYN